MQNLATLQFLESQFQFSEGQKHIWLQRWISGGFEAVEKMLEKYSGTYCFGESLTAADCFLVPQVFASKRFNIELSRFPLIRRISSDLERLESFKKAHPTRQPDTPLDLKA